MRTVLLVLPVFLWALPSLAMEPVLLSSSALERCNPIGRITSGRGGNFSEGDIVCLGRQLEAPRSARMLCFSSQAEVSLPNTTLTVSRSLCGSSSLSNRDCSGTQCFYPKGADGDSRLAITQPDVDAVSSRTPSISWSQLSNATSYRVTVSGPSLMWSRTVSASHLAYPADEMALSAGNAYSINIVALDGTAVIARVSAVINTSDNNLGANFSDQDLVVHLE
jgi:hypothetical protein